LSWFQVSTAGITTGAGVENDNKEKVTVAAVQNSQGMYIAVIYNAKSGAAGSITVAVNCNGSPCPASQFVTAYDLADIANGSPVGLTWDVCCEDGFLLGPFQTGENVCLTHSYLENIKKIRFMSGADKKYDLADETGTPQVCVSF
jgi:hypothetical protein